MSQRGLFIRSWGQGPPVLYLHGLGASSRYWASIPTVGAGHQAIAPDLLGFGKSPKPPNATYDVECHLRELRPCVPAGTVVVGHSMGAILAAALTTALAGRIRGVVLVGLPAYPDEATARAEIGGLGTLAALTARGSWIARATCFTMCQLRPLLFPLAPKLARDIPPEIAGDFLRHTWASYSRTLENVVIAHRVSVDLAAIDVPVVFLHGRQDRDAPPALVRAIAAKRDEADRPVQLRLLDGDHHVALRHPRELAACVKAVL